jgi:hypothetical protein
LAVASPTPDVPPTISAPLSANDNGLVDFWVLTARNPDPLR